MFFFIVFKCFSWGLLPPRPPASLIYIYIYIYTSFFFSLHTGYGENIFQMNLLLNKMWNCCTKAILKPINMNYTQSFVLKKLSAGMFEKISFPYYGLKNRTSFFDQPTNLPCPILSLFAWPSQKSDVLYGCSPR